MTENNTYTDEQRAELKQLVVNLAQMYKGMISNADCNRLDHLLRNAVATGVLAPDNHNIEPVLRHMRTAWLLSSLIAPDRNLLIATLSFQMCRKSAEALHYVEKYFGDDVAHLVHGLMKVSQMYSTQNCVRSENFQKLLLAFANDIRVIMIMIVDRLALMRVIGDHPDRDFVQRIALESRFLYAPLAHRLGLNKIKSELEDTSLKYLNRKVYNQIAETLNSTKTARDKYVADFIEPVRKVLEREGLKFEIKGRTKSINSIWNKIETKHVDINHIYDLFAIRIIIDTPLEQEKRDCWLTYSLITDMYPANPSRMRDWITIPKGNGYESLHATVQGPQGNWVEVQIRTRRMDEVAERGLAAHWKYKGVKSEEDLDKWINSVREVLEAGREGGMEKIRNMNMRIYDNEVFVFTPKGDLHRLPQGASVLDFAYAIHTKIGSTCVGARVDGKNQRLGYKLQNGDTVEVLTSSTQVPRLDWLNMVVTSRARNKIKVALNESNTRHAEMGRELLERRLKNRKLNYDEGVIMRMAKRSGHKSIIDFFVALNDEKIDVTDFVDRYEQELKRRAETSVAATVTARDFVLHPKQEERTAPSDVLVIGSDGIKGIKYVFSKCCKPIMGDKIVGFVSSDGAIKIHRVGCGNVRHLIAKYPYRMIRAQWSGKIGSQFAATLRVVGRDDIGIVSNISSLINKTENVLLRNISINSHDGDFDGVLVLSVPSLDMLDDLMAKIQTLKGVRQVMRL